ncbi:hypothetical protein CTheo_8666 [Ceratobasidium theobromae]|uniref:Transmembrane protein n=1 Tax=Ceratobasidium theobromae TaxID=1582974 RepID=A0A5N5Q8R4_9AGAM|nr:hypothetical protein CTheo_8666 [Ceratobasidium theobromae]
MPAPFSRQLWNVRQTLFPTFEQKPYHLQFRHAALVTMMLMCAGYSLPAYHQTVPFAESWYIASDNLPIESSYNELRPAAAATMFFNVAAAFWIALHLAGEPLFRRGAPVWYEVAWMFLLAAGETISLAMMASSRPDVCDFHFGVDDSPSPPDKLSEKNSATSICSNWHGMTGLLAAIIGVFLLHILWHTTVSMRYIKSRKNVFVHPIGDYRWKLPTPLERIHVVFPADVEADGISERKESKDLGSTQYSSTDYATKSAQSDTLSFPVSSTSDDYNNFSRPSAPSAKATLTALPVGVKPLVLQQSIVTKSDASSIVESDQASSTHSPNKYAPFAYEHHN